MRGDREQPDRGRHTPDRRPGRGDHLVHPLRGRRARRCRRQGPGGDVPTGERRWVKVKHLRTVDCVVGGYRSPRTARASGPCCWASTTPTARCITSATPRLSTLPSGARSSSNSSRWSAVTASVTGERRAVRAAGSAPPTAHGHRCRPGFGLRSVVRPPAERPVPPRVPFLRWRPDKAPPRATSTSYRLPRSSRSTTSS